MMRFLLLFSILTLNIFSVSSQIKSKEFDRLRISHNGDSLIKQEFELLIQSKKVFFITPFASYLHIKGEKYKTRVRYDKTKRKMIFVMVDNLNWTNLIQKDYPTAGKRYYVISTFNYDKLINTISIPETLLPTDFTALYENLKDSR